MATGRPSGLGIRLRRFVCGAAAAGFVAGPAFMALPASAGGKGGGGFGGAAFFRGAAFYRGPTISRGVAIQRGGMFHPGGAFRRSFHNNKPRPSFAGFASAPDPYADFYPSGVYPPDFEPAAEPPAVKPPPQPVTRRIPERYLDRARQQRYAMLWVKTANGWRLDSPTACTPTPRWERTPNGVHLAMKSDCEQ